jgi:hypothetical protein
MSRIYLNVIIYASFIIHANIICMEEQSSMELSDAQTIEFLDQFLNFGEAPSDSMLSNDY